MILRVVEPSGDKLLILDPRDPMESARALIAADYMRNQSPTLHHHRGSFYEWSGAHYREVDAATVRAAVWKFLEQAQRKPAKGSLVPFRPTSANVGNVLDALAAASNLPAYIDPPAWLDSVTGMPAASELIAVSNGLLHLPSGKLYPPSPDLFNLTVSGVAYDADAPEPVEWLKFLNQVWPNDQQSIETLQEVFGYMLAADTSQQKIFLIVGPKRSGKGTIARVLTRLLGQDSVAAPTLASLSAQFGLAPLIGKPLAIIADARLGSRADQATIAERLLSISGEDSQGIDRKYRETWTGRLPTRFLIISNELPRLSDVSGALTGRLIVMIMEQSFYGREDLGLIERLTPELSGILNWAREGYLRLRSRGHFVQPESACEALAELEALGSPVGAFVKQRCVVEAGRHVQPEDLFEAWKKWCEANNRKEPGTVQSFGRDLRAAVPGLRMIQPRFSSERVRFYEGIALHHGSERTQT